MSLTSGSRVGPYTVIEPLGTGGMGEVFRAHDARLGRDVALKILPASAVADPASRARFEREARALAALNHSAVAQIFSIESHGDAPVIVMEVVDGPTLAERLEKGPLPLPDALAIATQICDGLEAAHERGIVHRDLKPANVKVRSDGAVKLLDFGIARALDPDTPRTEASTVTGGSTETGMVVGTPAYMSPEQAKGQPVDKRTDIWAFGCVLFEMLSGTRAFPGESTAEILASIVHQEPGWSTLPAGTPRRVVELLRRCLQKNVRDRLRDIGDARYELAHATRTGDEDSGGAARPRTLQSAAWFAAGAAALGLLLLAVAAFRPDAEPPAPAYRTAVALPAETTLALNLGSAVVISPDGLTLAYTGRSNEATRLYVRRLDEFESRPLPGTENAQHPFFSPDGQWIGFVAGDKLKRVSIDGGVPISILDVDNPRGHAWAADRIVYTPTNTAGLSQIVLPGGKPAALTTLEAAERSHRWPHALPGGSILFSIWSDLGWDPAQIALRGADGTRKTVIQGGGYPRYLSGAEAGYLVYARAEGLMAVRFDPASGSVQGQPVPVVDGVITNTAGGAHFDVSSNGTLAFVSGGLLEADRRLVWVTMDGTPAPALQATQGIATGWQLSRDGRRVVRNNTIGQSRETWIEDLAAATSIKLPNPSAGFVSFPVWSPDGTWLAFSVDKPVANIYRQPADGTSVVERLTESPHRQVPRDISRDGRHLLYTEIDPATSGDVWVLTLPQGPPGAGPVNPASLARRPLVNSAANEQNPVFSPDGAWIAYQSNDTGRFEIYLKSFPAGDRTVRISTDGGGSPAWSADGREILFRDASGKLRAAALSGVVSGGAPKARELFDARGYGSAFGVAPDGKRLLMIPVANTDQAPRTINIIFNFLDELRRRVR